MPPALFPDLSSSATQAYDISGNIPGTYSVLAKSHVRRDALAARECGTVFSLGDGHSGMLPLVTNSREDWHIATTTAGFRHKYAGGWQWLAVATVGEQRVLAGPQCQPVDVPSIAAVTIAVRRFRVVITRDGWRGPIPAGEEKAGKISSKCVARYSLPTIATLTGPVNMTHQRPEFVKIAQEPVDRKKSPRYDHRPEVPRSLFAYRPDKTITSTRRATTKERGETSTVNAMEDVADKGKPNANASMTRYDVDRSQNIIAVPGSASRTLQDIKFSGDPPPQFARLQSGIAMQTDGSRASSQVHTGAATYYRAPN
ncbi:hypothetical protein DAEQUDRAFT_760248 [Daedalea quercina L-15889]|uniref:Uncharacterized protein n=1 Tax=Daedalea quercina L-15889 TaxID=1314783 RepID=A0A165L457_9APHY|nr:hypothetical protein DAEQUDRAFT_760248 [Daedalea quercina L-15889]